MTDAAASQREVDILRERVEAIDAHGTRGIGAIQLQVTELIKDVTELRADTRTWQEGHGRQHAADQRDRVTGRRWLIGTAIAGIVAMAAILGLLLDITSRLHK